MFFEDEMTLIDWIRTGFGVLYLLPALYLGSKVSLENSSLLELLYDITTVDGKKRVVKKRPYKPAEERTKEDKSRKLPKRLSKADNNKVEKQLPIVKKAKRRLLLALSGTYVAHQIACVLLFPDDPKKWLIAPASFIGIYLICLLARARNRLSTLAHMEGYRVRRF